MLHEKTFAGFFKLLFEAFNPIEDWEADVLLDRTMTPEQRQAATAILMRRREILHEKLGQFASEKK